MKKQYFLIVDTETTQTNMVADFAAIVCDRKGRVITQCAVLTNGIYTDTEKHPLFFTNDSNPIWDKRHLDKRYDRYRTMIAEGQRMVGSVSAINRWLAKAAIQYDPIITAYNLAFDRDKCHKTGIDLAIFERSFCLWQAAATLWGSSKAYRQFILESHGFNAPTQFQNMSYKTNAEVMARFVLRNPSLPDEPHTALEDVIYYELPILKALTKRKSTRWLLEKPEAYNWRSFQVKDAFQAK